MCSRGQFKQTIHLQNIYHPFWPSLSQSLPIYFFKTWSMISCCGLAYDGSLSIDDSSLSRKLIQKSSVPWNLHASMAGFSPSTTVCIIDLRSNDSVTFSTSAQSFTFHGLYWVLWEPLTLLVVTLTLLNSLHYWLVIKWFLPCSTSTHLFTWIESYWFEKQKSRPRI